MEDFFDRLQAIVGISKYSNSEVIYRSLMDSPLLSHMDKQSRRRHILENQLYGCLLVG